MRVGGVLAECLSLACRLCVFSVARKNPSSRCVSSSVCEWLA